MTKLEFTERIREEENKKVKYIIIGLLLIFFAWILLNLILEVSYLGKVILGIVLFMLVVYLGVEWYRAYYK